MRVKRVTTTRLRRWRVREQLSASGRPGAGRGRRARRRDLGGDGAATAPAAGRGRAEAARVVFGLAALAETMRQCGMEAVDNLVAEGQWRDRSRPTHSLPPAPPPASGRGADRAELPRPPVGHRDPHRPLRRGGGRDRVAILDTRKTTPGLRRLEKAAVLRGGRQLARPLDAILIKENHIALAGGLAEAVGAARRRRPRPPVEVECRGLDEVAARSGPAPTAFCSTTWTPTPARGGRAARRRRRRRDGPTLEASGGVDLQSVRGIAETGVELISVGALTHSAPRLDLSMLVEPLSG